LRSTKRLNSSP